MMVKHSVYGPSIKLIQDETLWEVFLRRAGMNAFAAQAVLGMLNLKPRVERDGRVNCDFGLTEFMKMGEERRVALFERVCGGREVLGRVGRAIEAQWE